MAVFQFSALSDGQAISFNPNADVLNFDQTSIAAADLRVSASGTSTRVEVVAGPQAGKDVTLLSTVPFQLATTNITFADGSRLLFGDNSTAQNDNAASTLTGTAGRDLLAGFGGADTLNGGLGNDTYIVSTGDLLTDSGGIDTVESDVNWELANGFENLTATGTANVQLTGNNGVNVLIGNSGNNFINPRGGDDLIAGGAGNDWVRLGGGGVPSYGSKSIDGGAGFDTIDFGGLAKSAIAVNLADGSITGGGEGGAGSAALFSIEAVIGDGFNDQLRGSIAAESLGGGGGNDTLDGRGGNDTLTGGLGQDTFAFASALGGNVDQVTDFTPATDKLSFDNSVVFTALGAPGNFAAGDPRFAAGAGFTSGRDASDRIVYNTTTGQLFYDADGNGAGASQLVATLQGAPALSATDILVVGTGGPAPVQGTAGNDSLTGTGINDSLAGLEGDDTLRGLGGNDTLDGGPGNDRLDGGPNTQELDALSGGLGNDTFELWEVANDLVSDAGGIDTILAHGGTTWILPTGIENLVLTDVNGLSSVGDAQLTGNELNNVIRNEDNSSQPGRTAFIDGADGDDTLIGGTGQDHFVFAAGSGSYGNDSVDGGIWIDDLVVGQHSAVVVDFRAGTVVGGGTAGSGSVRFTNIEAAFGGAFDDRLIANDSGVELFGGNGSDTMLGGAGDDVLWQNDFLQPTFFASDTGNDQIFGGAGNDAISGFRGNNLMDGGPGDDAFLLIGAQGQFGADTIVGGDGLDQIELLAASGAVLVNLSTNSIAGAGLEGLAFSSIEGFRENGGRFNDHVIGTDGANLLATVGGDDLLEGGAGNDTLIGGGLDDFDPVDGNNTLDGGLGNDSLVGTREFDNFLFRAPNSGADRVANFRTDQDSLHFDNTGFTAIGGPGTFASGDARFFAGAGATSGQDASDRIVYDASTGNVYYDADGSAGGAAQLIATLEGRPALNATNIVVVLGSGVPGGIVGTEAPDTLTGTEGNDNIAGFGGNDSINGLGGDDTLDGGAGIDTMNGGLGNDSYIVTANDQVSDPGGIDTVVTDIAWSLNDGFENLTVTGIANVGLTGNNGTNILIGNSGNNFINPRGGNDSISGGAGNDFVRLGGGGVTTYGSKVIDLGTGFDGLDFGGLARSAIVVDLAVGTLSGGGDARTGSATLINIEQVIGDGFNDRLSGSAVDETLNGGAGNDTLNGRGGNDTLTGGLGSDAFAFATTPGTGNVELVSDFASATDRLNFDNAVFTALGADGNFVAGDARFAAGAGFTSGRDVSDRLVYNTTLGQLFYDADGSGAGAAQFVAAFQGNPAITATDITVI